MRGGEELRGLVCFRTTLDRIYSLGEPVSTTTSNRCSLIAVCWYTGEYTSLRCVSVGDLLLFMRNLSFETVLNACGLFRDPVNISIPSTQLQPSLYELNHLTNNLVILVSYSTLEGTANRQGGPRTEYSSYYRNHQAFIGHHGSTSPEPHGLRHEEVRGFEWAASQ